MTRLDLNAVHKARREAEGEPHVVELGDRTFELPASPPAKLIFALGEVHETRRMSALKDAIAILFGEDIDEVLTAGFELDDLGEVLGGLYGMDVGESQASGG